MNLNSTSAHARRIFKYCQLLGLSKPESKELVVYLHSLVSHNGEEYCVKRLKDLKTWYIQHLAGNTTYSPSWFKKTKNNLPKEPIITKLFKQGLNKNSKKTAKIISLLMVYTAYIAKSVTKAQIKKSLGSINQDYNPSQREILELRELGKMMVQITAEDPLDFHTVQKSINHGIKPWKKKFEFCGLNTYKPTSSFGPNSWTLSYIDGLNVPMVSNYIETEWEAPSAFCLQNISSDIEAMSPGEISIIQEKGYKARVVAMPKASVQVALKPLHNHLRDIISGISNDCTLDQTRGANAAQQALNEGKTVYCVDLSSATDNFPKYLQYGVLDALNLSKERILFETLHDQKWRLSPDLRNQGYDDYIKYTKGTAQGLNGGFFLFTLTHNLLVNLCRHISNKRNGNNNITTDDWYIVGDDIVIFNKDLYDAYMHMLNKLNCPVSHDKCLISNTYAEFAGKIITKNKQIQPCKFPSRRLDQNWLNLLRVTGIEGVRLLPKQLHEIAYFVCQLPTDLGGLGYNPQGLSYKTRTSLFVDDDKELKVPEVKTVISELLSAKFNVWDEGSHCMIDYLAEQAEYLNEELVRSIPKKFRNFPSNLSQLLYQFSHLQVMGVTAEDKFKAFRATKIAKAFETHQYSDDKTIWMKKYLPTLLNIIS